jgi:hypothetical protein
LKEVDFSKIIREITRSKGYSYALLAHQCECSVGYLQDLQKGKRKVPNYNLGRTLVEMHTRIIGDA